MQTRLFYLNRGLAIGGFALIILSLICIVLNPPATNYEFSIYDAYPLFFWVSLIGAIIIGAAILLFGAFLSDEQNNTHWFFGIAIILLADSILLFMPFIRGYLNFGSGDVLSHIGWMKDIIRTGYVGSSNIYPIDHILGVVLNFFSGLSLQQITMIVPALFSLFFIISLYLLSTIIFPSQPERLILLAFGSILLFSNYNMAFLPNAQAFMLLPFVFYLIIKNSISKEGRSFTLLVIIMTSLLVFYHPLVILIVISILLVLRLLPLFQNKLNTSGNFNIISNKLIALLVVLFISWSYYLVTLANTIKPILDTITGSSTESVSEFQQYSNSLLAGNVDLFYRIQLTINIYGAYIILLVLSLVCCTYILSKIIRKEKIPYIYLIAVVGFLTAFIISLLAFLLNGTFGFVRIYICAIIFSLILIPVLWRLMTPINKTKTVINGILLLVLAIVLWLSIFNLYYSPNIEQANQQVTKSEYLGMITFYQIRDTSYPILELGLYQNRMYDAIYGYDYPRTNVFYNYLNSSAFRPPFHLGYNSVSSLGDIYNEPHYFLLTNAGEFVYQHFFPESPQKWKFDVNDFEQLKIDPSVQQIYDNGNLKVSIVE